MKISPDTAGNTWAPEAYWDEDAPAVRRVLGLQAVRRERPEPHRQHLQPDALRHHPRLRHLQRGEDLAGPRRVAHRLHRDQGERHLLPLHQGRGRRRHRLLRHHPGEVLLADRRRPAGQPVLGASWTPASAATPAPRRSRARRSSRPTRATPPARPTTCSSTSTAAAATSRSAPTTWRPRTGRWPPATTCPPARVTAPSSRSPRPSSTSCARGSSFPSRPRRSWPTRTGWSPTTRSTRRPAPPPSTARATATTAPSAGDATWADGGLTLGGTNGHVKLPDNMMTGLEAITVSTEVWVDPTQATPYFIWGMGNTTERHRQRLPVHHRQRLPLLDRHRQLDDGADRDLGGEPGPRRLEDADLHAGAPDGATLYLDGVKVGEKTGVTIKPGRHRWRRDHGQLHRSLGLHRRQVPQGQGARLQHLQPGAVGRRGQRAGCRHRPPSSAWSSTA